VATPKISVSDAVLELAKLGRLTDETAASLGDDDAKARLKAAGRDVPGEKDDADDDKSKASKDDADDDKSKASSTSKGANK
jgi:hypothetical protein